MYAWLHRCLYRNIDFYNFFFIKMKWKKNNFPADARQSIASDVKFTEREKRTGRGEKKYGRETRRRSQRTRGFLTTAYGLFATFYTHFVFLSLTTCSSTSFLHGQFIRVRCLPAGLVTSSLTSGSKRNPSLIPFFSSPFTLFQSFCSLFLLLFLRSALVREWTTSRYPRLPRNELVKR